MSQPSFVTQAKRPNEQKNLECVEEDDDSERSCCSCLFGNKKKNSIPLPKFKNQDNTGNKIRVPSDIDRDEVGINSPRGNSKLESKSRKSPLLGPQKPGREGRKCIVLDLDETLVHSSFQPVARYDFIVPVEIDENVFHVYVAKRPHVDEFLKKVGEIYEVVVFTASLSKYADPVLDLLDTHNVIDYRLFREHCSCINDMYIKDMSIMGRPIESIFIIDNSPHAYSLQPENAIPCISWFDDTDDTELLTFIPLLQKLAKPSVTNIITELDRLHLNGLLASLSQFTTSSEEEIEDEIEEDEEQREGVEDMEEIM